MPTSHGVTLTVRGSCLRGTAVGEGDDTFVGIGTFYGSQHDDSFTVDESASVEFVWGYGGNDILNIKGGAYVVGGGEGDDTYYDPSTAGAEEYHDGPSNDTYYYCGLLRIEDGEGSDVHHDDYCG